MGQVLENNKMVSTIRVDSGKWSTQCGDLSDDIAISFAYTRQIHDHIFVHRHPYVWAQADR